MAASPGWGPLERAAAKALGGQDPVDLPASKASGSADVVEALSAVGPQATPQPKGRRCKSGRGQIIQGPIQAKDLPVRRPPDWQYCNFACAESYNITTDSATNEIFVQVVHKPIAGVTPEMAVWWFKGNVEGDMTHPVDGMTYPRYHVWHPRDHLYQLTKRKSPLAKTVPGSVDKAVWRITEFIIASQRYLKSDANCIWSDEAYANDDIQVVALNITGLFMQLSIGLSNKPMRLRHLWSASPQGLILTSELRIGFQVKGTYTDRKARTVKSYNNKYARKAFGGRDPEGTALLWAQHCLEEFSNMKHFLPALYKNITGL